jgi:hypothetical protein
VSCLWIVLDGEGEEGGARGGAEFENRFVAVGIETSASPWNDGWVFNPDFEASVCANGGYEVGVDEWGEPLNLEFVVRKCSERGIGWRKVLLGSQQHAQSMYRITPSSRLHVDCRLSSYRLRSWLRSGRRSY